MGLPSTLSNAEISIEFFGSDNVGTFSKVYKQYLGSDTLCGGVVQLSYMINGTYAVHNASDCGGVCTYVRMDGEYERMRIRS